MIKSLDAFCSRESLHPLDLCDRHKIQLIEITANDITAIIQTSFFQKNFKDFLPKNGQSGTRLYIRVNAGTLLVQKFDEDQAYPVLQKTVSVDNEKVRKLNMKILQKANSIYLKCHPDFDHHRRSNPFVERSYSSLLSEPSHTPQGPITLEAAKLKRTWIFSPAYTSLLTTRQQIEKHRSQAFEAPPALVATTPPPIPVPADKELQDVIAELDALKSQPKEIISPPPPSPLPIDKGFQDILAELDSLETPPVEQGLTTFDAAPSLPLSAPVLKTDLEAEKPGTLVAAAPPSPQLTAEEIEEAFSKIPSLETMLEEKEPDALTAAASPIRSMTEAEMQDFFSLPKEVSDMLFPAVPA